MPFLDGFFSSIGQILPGYIEGRQQAIKDNWQDMSNFNDVLGGQIDNSFSLETFEPRARMMRDAAENSYLGYLNNVMTTQVNQAYQPARLVYGYAASEFAPDTATNLQRAQQGQARYLGYWWQDPHRALQQMGIDPNMAPYIFSTVSGMGASPNVPSILQ